MANKKMAKDWEVLKSWTKWRPNRRPNRRPKLQTSGQTSATITGADSWWLIINCCNNPYIYIYIHTPSGKRWHNYRNVYQSLMGKLTFWMVRIAAMLLCWKITRWYHLQEPDPCGHPMEPGPNRAAAFATGALKIQVDHVCGKKRRETLDQENMYIYNISGWWFGTWLLFPDKKYGMMCNPIY